MATFTDTRTALANALSTVPGITGYEFRPSVLRAGAAWPLLGSVDRGPGDFWSGSWRVLVYLGGEEKAAQEFLDAKLPILVEVLDPIAYVDQAVPTVVPTDAGGGYAVEIRVRSE